MDTPPESIFARKEPKSRKKLIEIPNKIEIILATFKLIIRVIR